jgi:hypothetical protein
MPPDGAPTVGVAQIGRGVVLERHVATCDLQNPLRTEWFYSVLGYQRLTYSSSAVPLQYVNA